MAQAQACQEESTKKILDPSSVTFGEKIGDGGFAVVYKVQYRNSDGQIVEAAAKRVDDLCEQEIEYLAKLQHENIINYFGYFKDQMCLTIITELAEKGDLKSYLQSRQESAVPSDLASRWMREAARGVKYLHNKDVVHRDIKSANYLIMADDTLKLADFGLAKELDQTMSTVSAGTVRWMAPEVIRDLKRSKLSDIFALVIVFWEILTRGVPFAEEDTELGIMTAICDNKRPVIPEECPDRLRWLLENGWHWDYQQRPNAGKIVAILEAAEGRSVDDILTDLTPVKTKETKELATVVFHPDEQREMEKGESMAFAKVSDYTPEMDHLEAQRQRMIQKGREKKAKAKKGKSK